MHGIPPRVRIISTFYNPLYQGRVWGGEQAMNESPFTLLTAPHTRPTSPVESISFEAIYRCLLTTGCWSATLPDPRDDFVISMINRAGEFLSRHARGHPVRAGLLQVQFEA